ncbi:MAG: flagellar biosynthesis anti-sigma factor FlgM [Acidobacteria bacterium]|nr:flagellar biosynthesis anti-sigma factor FlgM [Acidobacteriota bacterium]MCB9396228.1 flagellar biosynthesis anti-sigma factor FlgM [Acidobacteriota bacterium]
MKIEKKSTSATQFNTTSKKVDRVNASVERDDSVELSQSASILPLALDVLERTPDIRSEAVDPIRQELADGKYHRDEVKVAEKVIEDHLVSAS